MEEENNWVFDSLVCFLNGPIWNAPLQSFIEEKSLIFEHNGQENEEYKKIFDEFKNLVDFMLGNFMEDIGISPEQFENACKEGKKYQLSFDQNLFEQIWAANDYEMFKKMMIQRNVELQLQALELIERKYGITPQSFVPKGKETITETHPVMIEKTSEEEVMNEIQKKFPEDEPSTSEIEVKSILKQKEELEKTLEKTKSEIKEIETENDISQLETEIELKKPIEIDAVELKKRQEYLRAQRDKLVALKKEARRKQLGATEKRPRSAKAAENVLKNGPPDLEKNTQQRPLVSKTLAERLRSEVVGKELK